MKEFFKIPVEWSVYSFVEIEAESIEEAVKIFDETEEEIPLPTEAEYIEGSFQRALEGSEEDDIAYYKLFN